MNKGAELITLDAVYGASSFPVHRVVRVYSDSATNWDFQTGYYWKHVNQSVVDRMVEEGAKALTGASDAQTAWRMIMSTYVPGDKVGIKVNGNDFWNDNENEIDAIPQVINAVIKGLKSMGIPEEKIYVLEPTIGAYGGGRGNGRRLFYQYHYDIINGLYPNVTLLDGDDSTFVEGGDTARVGFPYAPGSRRISDLIVNVDHLILMPIMKAITPYWGITGSIKLMQGIIQDPMSLHNELGRETDDNPNVLIYKNQHIIGKTRLIVGDGLFGMWSGIHFPVEENGKSDVPDPWITFSNGGPNSLFFSIDPVAVDSVMRDFVNNERSARGLGSLPAPQLVAGQAAGLGIFEEAPYSSIDYIEFELGEPPSTVHDC